MLLRLHVLELARISQSLTLNDGIKFFLSVAFLQRCWNNRREQKNNVLLVFWPLNLIWETVALSRKCCCKHVTTSKIRIVELRKESEGKKGGEQLFRHDGNGRGHLIWLLTPFSPFRKKMARTLGASREKMLFQNCGTSTQSPHWTIKLVLVHIRVFFVQQSGEESLTVRYRAVQSLNCSFAYFSELSALPIYFFFVLLFANKTGFIFPMVTQLFF